MFGQYVYIDPAANVVIVKESSMPTAATASADNNDFLLFHAIGKHLKTAK